MHRVCAEMDVLHFLGKRTHLSTYLIVLQVIFTLAIYLCASETAQVIHEDDERSVYQSDLLEFLELAQSTEYEIVAPYEVDHKGKYISHAVAHHHRRKRSIQNRAEESVHFRLHGFGQDFHLELQSSGSLLAPGFTIQTLGKNGTTFVEAYQHEDLCFYQGSLRSKINSSVAISTCKGMSGLIRTQDADYFLKPLPQHLALKENFTAPTSHQPHILYKRSTDSQRHLVDNEVIIARRPKAMGYYSEGPHPQHPRNNYKHGELQKQHFCGRRKKYMPKPPEEDIYILPDEYKYLSRSKRAVMFKSQKNKKLNVETLVVVDRKMMQNHGNENITTYVLTILNMVSALFKDGTIGGNINIAIVGLVLLEDNQAGLVINHHADHSLNSFCQWQAGLSGKDGSRHDHAILLTGLDICSWKNEPCDTLGFAPISGMCSKYRSCTINEDTGLGLAFTIAHESGHNFGMIHDGEGNVCKKSEGNIMSPTLAGHNGIFSWSACSRQYLHRFLSSAQATCLADEPKSVREYKYPEKLPGELYDADTQCKWQFGEKAKLCMLDFKKDICKALWCHRVGRKCETKFMPAAEGTVCGPDMWCRRGQCLKHGDEGPRSVDGHWSVWSGWSGCSRSCGAGVTYRERHCNNPRYGGNFCEGSSRAYKLCNVHNCPSGSIDFRAIQCAEFNSKQFRGWYYNWKPYTRVDEQDLCKLYCYAEGFDFFFALSSKVRDGTSCSEGSSNVCIDGVCELVGCDRVLGSSAMPDVCGVCKGNNSTCKMFKGQYNKQHYTNQYHSVVTIPAGARSIRVYEMNSSSSYLSVRNSYHKYYLNGYWTVDWPGRHTFSGTVFNYKRPYSQPESLMATGPTNETLVVEILLQGRNPGVGWEYALPKPDGDKKMVPKHNYTWAIVRSECSVSCGGGQMTTKAACYRNLRMQVNISFCNPKPQPVTGLVSCNTQACPPSWSVGDWGECSHSCGIGEQIRQVLCTQKVNYKMETVTDTKCTQPVPLRRQTCNPHSCPPAWSAGPWSECSRKCGKGLKKRTVVCKSTNPIPRAQILPDSSCLAEPKPKPQESCMVKRCQKNRILQWFVSIWTGCSVTCGKGIQKRLLNCAEKDVAGKYKQLAPKRCHHVQKPVVQLERECTLAACPRLVTHTVTSSARAGWYSSPWSQCTVTCGGGVQARSVQCLAHGRPSSGCLLHQKPVMSQACNTNFCPEPEKKDVPCKDYFNWCYLVPQHGVCNHKFYGKQCCKSCSQSNL
ncbi:A disintegrin and metalloproteinase with thrombospondin motifs 16-like [Acipenser oxyrinchus oxyrinchus]|uniref:A disintegrin and metalloproteinase with thrombospondin motifs 16-like n=1 Tax=Acipenser oxyrinchus oxyrinchus TaxID=40147 RepID=A0AAD8GFN6_ACIOX|nr:A disintegrin and metalloproteinase with thrombospondin motifs 16-like [Acipenser oxyrinchus oxyrinchus]